MDVVQIKFNLQHKDVKRSGARFLDSLPQTN
jgi:hypothetical protein